MTALESVDNVCTGAKLYLYTKMWFPKPLKNIILKTAYVESIFKDHK